MKKRCPKCKELLLYKHFYDEDQLLCLECECDTCIKVGGNCGGCDGSCWNYWNMNPPPETSCPCVRDGWRCSCLTEEEKQEIAEDTKDTPF